MPLTGLNYVAYHALKTLVFDGNTTTSASVPASDRRTNGSPEHLAASDHEGTLPPDHMPATVSGTGQPHAGNSSTEEEAFWLFVVIVQPLQDQRGPDPSLIGLGLALGLALGVSLGLGSA